MKKWIIVGIVTLCVLGGWGAAVLSMSGGSDPAAEAAYYRALAQEQLELGGYGMALDSLEAVVKLQDTPENRLELIEAYEKAGYVTEYKNALKDFSKVYPERTEGYERLASYYDGVLNAADCVAVTQQASQAGVTSEALTELYFKNAFAFSYLGGSYTYASDMTYGTAAVENQGVWGLVDSSGRRVGSETYDFCAPFIQSLAAVRSGERSGFVDTSGTWYSVLPDGVAEHQLSPSQGLSVVVRNGQASYVDLSGHTSLGPYEDATGFANSVAAVRVNGMWQLIDPTGAVIRGGLEDVKTDDEGLCSRWGVIFVKTDGAWQLVDLEGEAVSALRFEDVDPFFDGTYAACCADGKWGFVDTEGQWALAPSYEGARSFGHSLAAVEQNGKWGFLHTSLRMVIEPQFDGAGHFSSGGVAPVEEDGVWRFIRLSV